MQDLAGRGIQSSVLGLPPKGRPARRKSGNHARSRPADGARVIILWKPRRRPKGPRSELRLYFAFRPRAFAGCRIRHEFFPENLSEDPETTLECTGRESGSRTGSKQKR